MALGWHFQENFFLSPRSQIQVSTGLHLAVTLIPWLHLSPLSCSSDWLPKLCSPSRGPPYHPPHPLSKKNGSHPVVTLSLTLLADHSPIIPGLYLLHVSDLFLSISTGLGQASPSHLDMASSVPLGWLLLIMDDWGFGLPGIP